MQRRATIEEDLLSMKPPRCSPKSARILKADSWMVHGPFFLLFAALLYSEPAEKYRITFAELTESAAKSWELYVQEIKAWLLIQSLRHRLRTSN